MTSTPTPTLVTVTGAGQGLTSAFTAVNGDFTAFQTWGLTVDNAIASILSQLYQPPPGAYSAPAAGQYQVYGQNATAWAHATSTGKVDVVSANNAADWGDIWDQASGTSWVAYTTGANAITFARIAIAAGVPSVAGTLALTTTSGNSGQLQAPIVIAAIPISSTVIKLIYSMANDVNNSGTYTYYSAVYVALITWSGTALSASYAQYTGSEAAAQYQYNMPVGSRRGFLTGSASAVVSATAAQSGNTYGVCTTLATGLTVASRTYDTLWTNWNPAPNGAWLGGGYRVGVQVLAVPADNNNRIELSLECFDDYTFERYATLRLSAIGCNSYIGIWALSNTLVLVQFKDASNNLWVAAISVNTTTNTLGLLGTFNAGYLGTYSFTWTQPICWNANGLDMYASRGVSGATMYLSHINYNSTTTTLSSSADVSVALGAGIAGITAATVYNYWQSGTDQLSVLYWATATTSGLYVETFTLS